MNYELLHMIFYHHILHKLQSTLLFILWHALAWGLDYILDVYVHITSMYVHTHRRLVSELHC